MDASSCQGMDAVKSIDLMGGNEYKGHTKNKGISLESPLTLMDASSGRWDGCCELFSIAEFNSLIRLPNSV